MTAIDFSPLFRSTIGFDRFTNVLETATRIESSGYPPYNIETVGENEYRITLALAGFNLSEIAIEVKENKIYISGSKSEPERELKYLHRGIANRSFRKTFQLADYVSVSNAYYTDGLLHIDLERELPEAMKPRSIKINNTESSVSSSNNNAA